MELVFSDNKKFLIRPSVLNWQGVILLSIGRSYVFSKSLKQRLDNTTELTERKAMVHAHDTSYLDFVMKWSMLFGNPGQQKVHWEKLLYKKKYKDKSRKRKIVLSFNNTMQNYLCAESRLTLNEYNKAKKGVVAVRNKYAAHVDIGRIPEIPNLKNSYLIAVAYSKLLSSVEGTGGAPTGIHPIQEHEEFYYEEAATLFA